MRRVSLRQEGDGVSVTGCWAAFCTPAFLPGTWGVVVIPLPCAVLMALSRLTCRLQLFTSAAQLSAPRDLSACWGEMKSVSGAAIRGDE